MMLRNLCSLYLMLQKNSRDSSLNYVTFIFHFSGFPGIHLGLIVSINRLVYPSLGLINAYASGFY